MAKKTILTATLPNGQIVTRQTHANYQFVVVKKLRESEWELLTAKVAELEAACTPEDRNAYEKACVWFQENHPSFEKFGDKVMQVWEEFYATEAYKDYKRDVKNAWSKVLNAQGIKNWYEGQKDWHVATWTTRSDLVVSYARKDADKFQYAILQVNQ
jgi:hypothetical protein